MTVIPYQGKLPEQFVDYYIYHNYLLMKGFKGPNPYFILGVTYLISKYKAYIWWLIISHLSIAVSDYCLCTVAVIGYNKDLNKDYPMHASFKSFVCERIYAGFRGIRVHYTELRREAKLRAWECCESVRAELGWRRVLREECRVKKSEWVKSVVWRRVLLLWWRVSEWVKTD